MLIQDFVDMPVPVDQVEHGLVGSSDMSVWARAAYLRGERIALGPGAVVATAVELEVGEPIHGREAVSIPVSWKAAGSSKLFPHMEAELILTPLSPTVTHVTFRGSYRPPLSSLGEVIDRLALHRLAEATVRNFLERLAAAVTSAGEPALQADVGGDPRPVCG